MVGSEKMQVLKMLEAGQISAEEAAKLLGALDKGEAPRAEPSLGHRSARWLRVRVTDMKTGKTKVNVNLPMGLVELGTRLGARFGKIKGLEDLDVNEIVEALKSCTEGRVVDVQDEEEGQKVEVFVE